MFLQAFVGVEEPQTELMLYQMKLAISGRFRQFYFLQKNADYENEKCLKIKVFICILHSKQKKDTLFLTSTRRYENLRKVSPFLIKSGTFLGFVFDIK